MCTNVGGAGRSSASGAGRSPLTSGEPQTISTRFHRNGVFYGQAYDDEALDASFDPKSGVLNLDWSQNKDWDDKSQSRKYSYVDITVQNGMINSEPVNLDLSNKSIKAIAPLPKNIRPKTEKVLRENGFEYNSSSKLWERGYKGYHSSGTTLTVDSKLPDDLSKFKTISGNTYDQRSKIKASGFKWDSASKSWIK